MEQLRKDKEAERFRIKQETRQKLIDKQCIDLANKRDNANQVLNKQVAEAEEKATILFMEKERRRIAQEQAIERSRK